MRAGDVSAYGQLYAHAREIVRAAREGDRESRRIKHTPEPEPMNTAPRLPPIPAAKPAAAPVPFRLELRAVVRDGYACVTCGLAVVADDSRRVVRLDPAAGDQLDNLATMCQRCADLEEERQRNKPPPP